MQDATEYMLSYSRTAKNSISLTLYVRSYDYVAFYLKFVRAATRRRINLVSRADCAQTMQTHEVCGSHEPTNRIFAQLTTKLNMTSADAARASAQEQTTKLKGDF